MNERITITLEITKKCSANIQIQKAGTKVASQDAKTYPAYDLGVNYFQLPVNLRTTHKKRLVLIHHR
jgi:hypothetical protein